jgi:hypothetical protein
MASDLNLIALHEAGHAVAALRLGITLEGITMAKQPSTQVSGLTVNATTNIDFQKASATEPLIDTCTRKTTFSCAGAAAEAECAGKREWDGLVQQKDDFTRIVTCIGALLSHGMKEPEISEWLVKCCVKARGIVKSDTQNIAKVAGLVLSNYHRGQFDTSAKEILAIVQVNSPPQNTSGVPA